jgi:hypothetical protein
MGKVGGRADRQRADTLRWASGPVPDVEDGYRG